MSKRVVTLFMSLYIYDDNIIVRPECRFGTGGWATRRRFKASFPRGFLGPRVVEVFVNRGLRRDLPSERRLRGPSSSSRQSPTVVGVLYTLPDTLAVAATIHVPDTVLLTGRTDVNKVGRIHVNNSK